MYVSLIENLCSNPYFYLFIQKLIRHNFKRERYIISKFLNNNNSVGRVLDYGCGCGQMSLLFNPKFYYGIDINERYINFAKRIYKGKFFLLRNTTDTGFENESFDLILVLSLFHHLKVEDGENVVKEIFRILKYDGKIIISEPTLPSLEFSLLIETKLRHINLYSIGMLRLLFKKYFKICVEENLFGGIAFLLSKKQTYY